MSDNLNGSTAPGKGHRFKAGHPPYRRKVPPIPDANEITALGMTAGKLMLLIAQRGYILEPGGKKKTVVDTRQRMLLLRSVAAMFVPKVPAIIQHNVEQKHAHVDLTALMQNPEMVAAAEKLALAMLGEDPPAPPIFDVNTDE